MMRPMVLEFPDDPTAAYLDRQYMLGPDVLVAPVMSADGQVTFYVPAGTWTHLVTGAQLTGPAWVTEKHGFDSVPVLARPGSVIPFGAVDDRPDYEWADGVQLRLFAPVEGQRTRVRVPGQPGGEPAPSSRRRYRDGEATAELVAGESSSFSCVTFGSGRSALNGPHISAESFVWGSATASYQIEGAATEDGRGPSIWDTYSHTPGRTLNGDTGDVADDHYHRWAEDLEHIAALGLDAYRFSISWPRVQPGGSGAFNQAGIDFYSRLVDRLLELGVRPVATMYHWDLPQELEDAGGWPVRETALRFQEYAAGIVGALGDRVHTWTTLNEPWCSAYLGLRLRCARARPHRAGRRAGRRAPPEPGPRPGRPGGSRAGAGGRAVGDAEPARDPAGHRLGRRSRRGAAHRRAGQPGVPRPDARRRLPGRPAGRHRRRHRLVVRARGRREGGRACRSTSSASTTTRARPGPRLGRRVARGRTPTGTAARRTRPWVAADDVDFLPQPGPYTAMGWNIDPSGMTELLLRLQREYPGQPLMITENGAAFDDVVSPDGAVHDASPGRLPVPAHRRGRRGHRPGRRRPRLLRLVAAGQLRVGLRLRPALRHHPGRLRDAGAHLEGQRALVPASRGDRRAAARLTFTGS